MKKWMSAMYGLIIGATMIVPGVSGGSMAMVLGVYDKLIAAVSSFQKEPKKNLLYLASFTLCALIGMFLFSEPVSYLLEHFPIPSRYFFLGAVFGGVPMIWKKAGGKSFSGSNVIFVMLGILIVLFLGLLPSDMVDIQAKIGVRTQAALILLGVPTASALVLPGISVSHFLLILGLYEPLLYAIRHLEWAFLLPLGFGILVGVILVTKLLEYVLEHFPTISYFLILGFVLGSLVDLFPGFPTITVLPAAAAAFLAGFLSLLFLSKF